MDTGVFNMAFSGAFPLTQGWRWTGSHFVLGHDGTFISRTVPDPPNSPVPLPPHPLNGTYGVAIRQVNVQAPAHHGLEARVDLTVEPEVITGSLPVDSTAGPSGTSQSVSLAGDTTVYFPAIAGKGIGYITAPAWYVAGLAASNENPLEPTPEGSPSAFRQRDYFPWYIPASLHLDSFALGADSFSTVYKPASAELTYRNGVVTRVVIALY